MAFFGFSDYNFGTEGPRDLKFGLLASPGVGLPRTRIKKNRVPVFFHPTVCHMLLNETSTTVLQPSVEENT